MLCNKKQALGSNVQKYSSPQNCVICIAACLPCVAAECYGFSCTSDNIHRYRA